MKKSGLPHELLTEELDPEETLARALRIVDPNTGIVNRLWTPPRFNDEPKFFYYSASLCDTSVLSDGPPVAPYTGGVSVDRRRAMLKTLGEAIERYCLGLYRKDHLVYVPYSEIKDEALDPSSIESFSANQLREDRFERFKWHADLPLRWVKAYSLLQGKETFVPAQLVYVPFDYDGEPVLRFPITTGGACGSSLAGAIYRGLCEVIERDAFMIRYLNRLPAKRIRIEMEGKSTLSRMYDAIVRYRLEMHLFDITCDIGVPARMAIIIDRSGVGPAVTVGLKAALDPQEAALGAVEEAQHVRPWIRDLLLGGIDASATRTEPQQIRTLEERGLFWSSPRMIQELDFWLNGEGEMRVDAGDRPTRHLEAAKGLQLVLNFLCEIEADVIFVDVTTQDIETIGLKVVRVIVPDLQPLYLNEEFPYRGGGRLHTVPVLLGYCKEPTREQDLNRVPHPFL